MPSCHAAERPNAWRTGGQFGTAAGLSKCIKVCSHGWRHVALQLSGLHQTASQHGLVYSLSASGTVAVYGRYCIQAG